MINSRWFSQYRIKIFSLLSALLLWLYVITDNNFEHVINVPIQLINTPKNWMLTQPIPSHVKVLFRGSGKSLLSLRYRKKQLELDMEKIQRKAVLPLTVGMIQDIPRELNVLPMRIVEPESIRIDLDRFVARKVPVESKIVMVPMDGYIQVGETNILPDSLVVTGPRSLVNTINKIETEEKTYRNLVKPIHGTIPMVPPLWETIKYALHQVKFQTDIQRIGERTISDIRVQVIRLPKSMKATVVPSTLSLKLQGGVKLLSKIEKEDISAIIDFRTRNRYSSKKIPAIIKLPPEISLSEVRPEFFELVVEK